MTACAHCGRAIVRDEVDGWVDPEATGDDSVWRETCDQHDTFTAEHEPITTVNVRDLQVGDRVDLEGDPFYSTNHDDDCSCLVHVENEYAVVDSVEIETPGCTLVHFEGIASCGFPPDHVLPVVPR